MESSKRKITEDDLFDDIFKKFKSEDLSELLNFSDCVLTCIFSYLNSYDLYNLSKSCTRFKYLVKLRKLWRTINVIDHPMCSKKFEFFFDKINSSTEVLMLTGINPKEKTLTTTQFNKLVDMGNNLTILAIERQYINSDEVRLCQFPKSLKELSLRGTHITGKSQFLLEAHKRLVNLHTLILDDCKWVNEHSLMALSKLTNLENLSLYNCRNLNDSVAYMSVTARFGFTKLLRIDARHTPIGDQFLKCFHCIKTLREIYLESPPVNTNKRNTLFDQIKRWCTSNMQTVPNVVIFNQSTVNTVFKQNRASKSVSKKRSGSSSPKAEKPPILRPENYDCLENHDDCSMEMCSVLYNIEKQIIDDAMNCGEDIVVKPEILYSDDVSDSDEESLDNYQMFNNDVTDAGVQWFCISDPQSVDNQGEDTYLFQKPNKKCNCRESLNRDIPNIDEPGPSGMSKGSKVDDCEAGPSTSHDTHSSNSKESSPADDAPHKPFKSDRKPPSSYNWHNPRRRVVFKRKRYHCFDSSKNPEAKRPCPDNKPSITVDLNIGEGPLHLEIINEITGSAQRPDGSGSSSNNNNNNNNNNENEQQEDNRQNNDSADTSSTEEDENVIPSPLFPRTLPRVLRREDDEHRNRDLRVIIERLDPGLHIVIDRAGRIQFGPVRANNYTKLKVLMVRGYKLITDQALRSLTDLRLEMLDVTGTSVTSNGIQQFLMVNPDCKVIHESLCTCVSAK